MTDLRSRTRAATWLASASRTVRFVMSIRSSGKVSGQVSSDATRSPTPIGFSTLRCARGLRVATAIGAKLAPMMGIALVGKVGSHPPNWHLHLAGGSRSGGLVVRGDSLECGHGWRWPRLHILVRRCLDRAHVRGAALGDPASSSAHTRPLPFALTVRRTGHPPNNAASRGAGASPTSRSLPLPTRTRAPTRGGC